MPSLTYRLGQAASKPTTSTNPANPKPPREFYIKAKQDAVAGVHPHLRMDEVKQLCGDQWRTLTPQEKQKYEVMAAWDKVRYAEELEHQASTSHDALLGESSQKQNHAPAQVSTQAKPRSKARDKKRAMSQQAIEPGPETSPMKRHKPRPLSISNERHVQVRAAQPAEPARQLQGWGCFAAPAACP